MDNWNEVSEIIGKENMWNINLQFLIDNCKTGTDAFSIPIPPFYFVYP